MYIVTEPINNLRQNIDEAQMLYDLFLYRKSGVKIKF